MTNLQGTKTTEVAADHRRVLYMIHVDWRWIKQRPQFLAESLAERHEVLVLHRPCVRPGIQLSASPSTVSRFPRLPLPCSWKPLRWGTTSGQRQWVASKARRVEPDTIW